MKFWKTKRGTKMDDRPSRLARLRHWLQTAKSTAAQKVGRARQFGAQTRSSVDERLRASWPTIQKAVLENAVDLARTAAQNDAELRKLFESVYQKLPPKMRRWVSSEQFVRFCFANRDRLLDKTQLAGVLPSANQQQIKP